MFESLLQSILEKTLGQYIQGLNPKDLEVSVWSGDVELNNVKVKKDIFQTFGLPLELIYGQIGHLKICVPWKSIGSKPVDIQIENVVVVVKPITDQSKWSTPDVSDGGEYQKKRDLINKFAHQFYSDMMKTKEEVLKEQGMVKTMITKIIDNLQVTLRNIHLRIENQDPKDEDATFSIGITLQSVDLNTTDANLKKTYVDRSLPQNQNLPIYKILVMKNFGIYYKINETLFVQNQEKDAERLNIMQKISEEVDKNGRFCKYADSYLLDPIQLDVKMIQFDPLQALEKLESLITLNINLESVGICLQKSQYDNLQYLIELTNQYMRFLNTASLRQIKVYWQNMQDTLQKRGIEVIKKNVRDLFSQIFKTQLEVVSKIGVEDKKAQDLIKELNKDLERQKLAQEFERIVLAVDYAEIETWLKEICTKKAEFDIAERERIKKEKQDRGFFGSMFGSSKKPEEVKKEELLTMNQDKLFQNLKQKISEDVQNQMELATIHAKVMKAIPKIKVDFKLRSFRVSLIDKEFYGVQWYSDGFHVHVKLYDSSNKYNPKTLEVQITNQAFGIVAIAKNKEDIPFVQQLKTSQNAACDITLKLGNVTHHESDLPQEMIDDADLVLKVKLIPIEIIYQATPISRIQKFFKVKNLDERTKLQASDQFNQLQNQVNQISKTIEADFRNNKFDIQVDAPTLVIPFKQNTLADVKIGECWVYTMGDVSFKDTTRSDIDSGYHECFELKVQRVRFEYCSKYQDWKNNSANNITILDDISTSTLLVRKREQDEMRTPENKSHLQALNSPLFQVIAGFDSDLKLSLKPEVFIKLTKIGTLLVAEQKPEEYWKNKKQKRIDSASFKSQINKQNKFYQWDKGLACLVAPRWLYFFNDSDITDHYYFDLNGCSAQDGIVVEGPEITLKNSKQEICYLQCPSIIVAQKWLEKLTKSARDLDNLKQNADDNPAAIQKNFQDQELGIDNEQKKLSEESLDEDNPIYNQVKFALKFTAPKIQLHLITSTANHRVTVLRKSEIVNWELWTQIQDLTLNFENYNFHSDVQAKVTSLKVTDNCGDLRFPVIFENQAVEHQNELVTLKITKIQKESPHYFDTDTEVSVGIGGLKIFWKPSSLIYLFRFLRMKNHEQPKPMIANLKNAVQQKVQQEVQKLIESDLQEDQIRMESNLDSGRDWQHQATFVKQGTIHDKGVQKKIKNCQQKPEAQVKVDVQLAFLQLVCIHPQNTTYPIFSIELKNLGLEYTKKCDCDQIKLSVYNLQIMDLTNYPRTQDPQIEYDQDEPLMCKEILGVNVIDQKRPQMLELQVNIFTYPETGSCPLQTNKDFSTTVSANLKQIRVIYMSEQLTRMIDYINHQIVLIISPDNLKEEKVQLQHLEESRHANKNHLLWQKFDLKQSKQMAGLDIKIQAPFVIIPDLRSDGTQQFDLDFGKISVTSHIQEEQGYWVFFPQKKIYTSSYDIKSSNIRFDFNQLDQRKKVFVNEKLDISLTKPVFSPFFDEEEPVFTGITQSPVFDLGQIKSCMIIDINLGLMKMDLPQYVMNKIFDILNNNLFMKDRFSNHFENSLRSKADREPEKPKQQISKQDRKTLQLQITASVLSLDLRDDQNDLISDICIVGFQYGLESYLSGRQFMYVSAGSFFIFFDEYVESNQKEMLMGHVNTPQLVFTDQSFYQELPKQLLQAGKPKFKFTLDKSENGDSEIILELLQLKLWVRPQVFISLSRYLVQALKRLQIEATEAQVEKVVSQATSKMQIHIDESLILVQNDKISEKCIVLQTSMDLIMKSKDPDSLKEGIQMNKEFYSMLIDITNVAGYLCDLSELAELSFKEAQKRELLQRTVCKINLSSELCTDQEIGLYVSSATKIAVNEADLKISIDDLQVLQSIINVTLAEIFVLQSVWGDYSSPKPDEEKKKEGMINLASMHVYLNMLNVLVINESKDFYIPLFKLFCEQTVYATDPLNLNPDQSKGKVSTNVQVNYYNQDAGYYEPVLERLVADVELETQGKNTKTKLTLDDVNVNFTIGLVECVSQFQKIYAVAQHRALSYQAKVEDLKQTFGSINPKLTFTRSNNRFSNTLTKSRERNLTQKQEREKFSSQYAVRNLTDKRFVIIQVDRYGKEIKDDPTVVMPDEVQKLVLQSTIDKDGSQTDQFIRIEFQEPGMIPVKRLNLSQNNYFIKHTVYKSSQREFFVICCKMESNRKIVTVRTQHVLTNNTKNIYHVKVFSVEKLTNKIIDIKTAEIEPGQSTPLQDFASAEAHQNVKISIRPKRHKKWGAEYKFVPMKTQMIVDDNTEWPHMPNYTIVKKLKTPLDEVYDYTLLPPIIVKNCLPCPLSLLVTEEFKDKIEVKSQDADGIKPLSQFVVLDKQDEKHIYDVRNKLFVKNLLIRVEFGSQFQTTVLSLNTMQSQDAIIPVKITDKKNRQFNVFVKVDTKEAGLKLIFYCSNILICNTPQKLSLFYQKKPGVFERDNSNEFPFPVASAKDQDVYIFDDQVSLVCSLTESTTFSERCQIQTAGHNGDFTVSPDESSRQFNFGYSVQMWLSAQGLDIPMTKVVEIAPQFIILNKTNVNIMFKQEKEPYGVKHQELEPGQRACFNWQNKANPKLFTFKPSAAEYSFCAPFNLKEIETINCCCSGQGVKLYYRIIKRQIDQSTFTVIEESEPPYVIYNSLKNVQLRIGQNDVEGKTESVSPQQKVPFAWSNVNVPNKLLEVEFRIQNQVLVPVTEQKLRRKNQQTKSKKLSLDGINQTSKIVLNDPTSSEIIQIYASVYKGAVSKVIEFSYQPSQMIIEQEVRRDLQVIEEESKEEHKEEEDEDDFIIVTREQKQIRPKIEGKDKQQFQLEINQLSVSLSMNRAEYMNVVLRTLRLQKVNTDSDVIYYATLDRIQIDNTYEAEPIFPVVVRPKCVAGDVAHNHLTMHNVDHVFGFYAHQKLKVPNVTFFSTVEFLLRELEIKVEFDYLIRLSNFFKSVQQKLSVGFYDQHLIFQPNEKKQNLTDYYEMQKAEQERQNQLAKSNWMLKEVDTKNEQVTYIQKYVGSSMCFEITLFKQTSSQEQSMEKEKGSLGMSIASSGLKLTNLNGAPIQLQSLEISDVYGSNVDIQYQFQQHYLSNMKYNILRIAGSSDLIGNPYNFMSNLGSGVKKYYRDPREQIMQGPGQAVMAGLQLVGGTAGMAAHSAASASGFIGRITATVNRGLVAASLDRDYIHKKEITDIKEKPTGTFDGIGKGFKSLGSSVASGIFGLVSKPIEGSKDGALGLVKGVGIGFAGLVTKPVTGVVDLVSKTTQGIESGVTGNSECKQNNQRLRKPRAFYLALNIIKQYSKLDADVYGHLKEKINKKAVFWRCCVCGEKKNQVMLLTQDSIYALSSDFKIIWQSKITQNLELAVSVNGIQVRSPEDKKGYVFVFGVAGQEMADSVQTVEEIKYASTTEDLAWVLI